MALSSDYTMRDRFAMRRGIPSAKTLTAALALLVALGLSACKVPEQRQAFYPNGFLRERYWFYREGGREVMHGLYTGWYPNGEREVEILYRDGSETVKTYYSEQGKKVGTVDLASVPDP